MKGCGLRGKRVERRTDSPMKGTIHTSIGLGSKSGGLQELLSDRRGGEARNDANQKTLAALRVKAMFSREKGTDDRLSSW